MEKLKSRKLGAAIAGLLLTACGLIASYIASQGYVDAKGVE